MSSKNEEFLTECNFLVDYSEIEAAEHKGQTENADGDQKNSFFGIFLVLKRNSVEINFLTQDFVNKNVFKRNQSWQK